MSSPIVGGMLAFFGGCAASALNFWINLRTLKRRPAALAQMSFVRQIISVGYLVAVFFLAKLLPWDYVPLLVGAAVGLTVPSVLLSWKLAKINDSLSPETEDPPEKGADANE